MDSGTVEVPLRARDGSVRAVALIDAADAERVLAHRWFLSKGYAVRNLQLADGRWAMYGLHRLIAGLEHGDPREVDHEDRDPLNCRRANLRVCTHAENSQNRAVTGNRGSRSRFRGVAWHRAAGKWEAYASVDGRRRYLGLFDEEERAAAAAAACRARHMPFSLDAVADAVAA